MRRIGSVATVLLGGLLIFGCEGAARHDQQTAQPQSGILADPNSREIAKALRLSFPSNTPREERSEWEERLHGYPPTQVALVAEALYEQATTAEERLRIVSEACFFAQHSGARRDALDPLGRMAKWALRDADPQTAAEAATLLGGHWWDDEEAEALVRYRLVSATDPDVLAALFKYIPPGKAPAVLQAEIRRPVPQDAPSLAQWEVRVAMALGSCRTEGNISPTLCDDVVILIAAHPNLAGPAADWLVRMEATGAVPQLRAVYRNAPLHAQCPVSAALAVLDPAADRWEDLFYQACQALAGYRGGDVGQAELVKDFTYTFAATRRARRDSLVFRLVQAVDGADTFERTLLLKVFIEQMKGDSRLMLVGLKACGMEPIREVLSTYPEVRDNLEWAAGDSSWNSQVPKQDHAALAPTREALRALLGETH